MTTENKDIQAIRFRFKTGGYPAPYSHRYSIDVGMLSEKPEVRIDLHYTDREGLSDEDIYDEGFTANDDFSWSGDFPEIWRRAILEKVRKESPNQKKSSSGENQHDLRLEILYSDGSKNVGHIPDTGHWERFLQEIIQAGMELAGREQPLIIRYLSNSGSVSEEKIITLAFAYRKADVNTVSAKQTLSPRILDWIAGTELIRNIYALDYDSDKSEQEKPSADGHYLDPGEGAWYNLEKHAHSPTRRKDLVAILIDKLERI